MVKKTASILSSIIIILAIGGFVFVSNFDLNRYKNYIEDIVLSETGRKLELRGDAKIALSLIPTVVINDVVLANPDWAANTNMVVLNKLEAQFSLMALLRKQINIKKFILVEPKVYLETSIDGQQNWNFAKITEKKDNPSSIKVEKLNDKVKAAGTVAAVSLIAKEVKIEKGEVIYYNAKTKKTEKIDIDEFVMEAHSNNEPMHLDVEAEYNNNPIKLKLELSPLAEIMQKEQVDFKGRVSAYKVVASFRGVLSDVMNNLQYQTELDVHNPAGNFGAPETSLLSRIDGDLRRADINIKSLNVATNLITGMVKVDYSKSPVMIDAQLKSDVFNVKSLNKESVVAQYIPKLIGEAKALTVVSDEIVPYKYLKMFDADLILNVGKLVLPQDMVFQNVAVTAKLNSSILNINKIAFDIWGGKVIGNSRINAINQSADLQLNANNLRVSDLYKNVANDNLKIINGGILDIEANLQTNGDTYRKLSENLNGRFVALVNKSVVKLNNWDWLTNSIIGKILDVLKVENIKEKQLSLECAVVNAKFKNGKAEFDKGIVWSSDKFNIVGSGKINLLNDNIDFTLEPMFDKLKEGNITQALASFVKINGTLSSPSIGLDKSSAISMVAGSLATGGVWAGSEILLGGNDNVCNTALQETSFVSRYPRNNSVSNTTKDAYQDVSKQAKDAVKEVGKAAKNLLRSLSENLKKE